MATSDHRHPSRPSFRRAAPWRSALLGSAAVLATASAVLAGGTHVAGDPDICECNPCPCPNDPNRSNGPNKGTAGNSSAGDHGGGQTSAGSKGAQLAVQLPDKGPKPVRYYNGEVILAVNDVPAPSGDGFGVTRNYAQRTNNPYVAGVVGNNWYSPQTPILMQEVEHYGAVDVMFHPNNPVPFDAGAGSTYTPRFTPSDAQVSLTAQTVTVNGQAVSLLAYQEVTGSRTTQVRFYGFNQPGLPDGQMYDTTDECGITTQAIYSGTALSELLRTWTANGTTKLQRLVYAQYAYPSVNVGQTQSVVLSTASYTGATPGTLTWSTVRGVTYTYYGSSSSNGLLNDLQSATTTDQNGNLIDTYYYRYDTGGLHLLTYVLNPASYARLAASQAATTIGAATLSTVDGLSNATVSPYADNAFSYDGIGRVTQEVAQGDGCSCGGGSGQGTYAYAYGYNSKYGSGNNLSSITNQTANWPNIWLNKTTETLPDGSTNVVYTNFARQVILKVHADPASTGNNYKWMWYQRYDASGDLFWAADPSAVSGFDESQDDLVDVSGTPYGLIRAGTGLLHIFDYGTTTTAGPLTGTPGNVAGQLMDEQVQQGRTGTPAMIRAYQYFKHAADASATGDGLGTVVYPVAKITDYNAAGGGGPEVTTYAPTYVTTGGGLATVSPLSMATSSPLVSAAQNGPAAADVRTEVYDALGRLQWVKDADGFVGYWERDNASGAATLAITDVDYSKLTSAQQALFPSGWSHPTGGLNLVASMANDDLGRTTKVTDPNGYVTYTVYNDASSSGTGPNHEVRVYHGWVSGAPTGPTQLVRTDRFGSYLEMMTLSATPATSGGVPTGQEAVSGVQTLSRSYADQSGRTVRDDAYFNLSGLTYATSTYIGTQWTSPASTSANYYTTAYAYDNMGRKSHVVDANGTVTDTTFEVSSAYPSRVASVSVGTNDVSGSSNMVKVADYFYDGGTGTSVEAPAGGDNTPTQAVQYPDATATHNRVAQMTYDWRDRLVGTKAGVQSSEDSTTHRPIVFCTLDNLGRCTSRCQYDGDGVTLGTTPPAATLLRKRVDTAYDDQDRPYNVKVFDVNQANGTDGLTGSSTLASGLVANTYYDHRGDPIASVPPGAPVTKKTYDGAGRTAKQYVTDGAAGATWAAAGTVTGDHVLQQVQYTYDPDGNAVLTTSKQRFNDATATGELGTTTTSPGAWVSFAAAYYDQANRPVASVQVGRVSGDSYAAPLPSGGTPPTPPARSDAVLVTSTTYNAAGWASVITDPRGLLTAKAYDGLGRVTQTVEAWDGSTSVPLAASAVAAAANRATNTAYDGVGHTYQLTAVMPTGTNSQTTQYNYGVGGSGQLYSNSLLGGVQYPGRTTGTAGTTAADKQAYAYDYLGEPVTFLDQNQTTHTYAYDVLGRRTSDSVAVASGNPQAVDQAVLSQAVGFDTAGRPYQLSSYNAASGGTVVNQVQMAYNGLGQVTAEYQSHAGAVATSTTPATQYAYVEMAGGANTSRLTGVTYPNGRVLYYSYNDAGDTAGVSAAISRVTALCTAATRGSSDANVIVGYTYLGLSTPVRKDYPVPKVRLDLWGGTSGTYAGLDGFGRVASQDWSNYNVSPAFDAFKLAHGYDRDSNRLYAANVAAGPPPAAGATPAPTYGSSSHVYAYDALNRLTADTRGAITADDTAIQPYWTTDARGWTLDTVGNQTSTDAGFATGTTDSANECAARAALGNRVVTSRDDEFTSNTAGDWAQPAGGTAAFDVNATHAGYLTVTGVNAGSDTIDGEVQPAGQAILLLGQATGPVGLTTAPSDTGPAGLVFGYKSGKDYWEYLTSPSANHFWIYHVTDDPNNPGHALRTATLSYGRYPGATTLQTLQNGSGFGGNGTPSGRVGLLATSAGTTFDYFRAWDESQAKDTFGRWANFAGEMDGRQSGNAGSGGLQSAADSVNVKPILLKGLRLQKWQVTVRPVLGHGERGAERQGPGRLRLPAAGLAGAGRGREHRPVHDQRQRGRAGPELLVDERHVRADVGDRLVPGHVRRRRDDGQGDHRHGPAGRVGVGGAGRVGDGPGRELRDRRGDGRGSWGTGRTGGGGTVQNVTVNSYDGATGAYDVTEAAETFTLDANGYAHGGDGTAAGDALASDGDGNQTFDGVQCYAYDAWNRLAAVRHGYRDGGNALGRGQVSVTMAYDARGRRVAKAVNGTGAWDCTYGYYYSGDRQVEQRNGSAQTVKQFTWGLGYVDDLVQTSLNSSPTGQSTCDTPYWACPDANYNVLGVVDKNGVVQERYEYTAYGQRTAYFSPGSNDVGCHAPTVGSRRFVAGSTTEPWGVCEVGHQGLVHDEECGLVYNRARELSPDIGRFLTRDPIGYDSIPPESPTYHDSGSTLDANLMEYAKGNPIYFTDASGNAPIPTKPNAGHGFIYIRRVANSAQYKISPTDRGHFTAAGHPGGYEVNADPGKCKCPSGGMVINQAIQAPGANAIWDINTIPVPKPAAPPGYVAGGGAPGLVPGGYFDNPGGNKAGGGIYNVEVCIMCQQTGVAIGCAQFQWDAAKNDFVAAPGAPVPRAGTMVNQAWHLAHRVRGFRKPAQRPVGYQMVRGGPGKNAHVPEPVFGVESLQSSTEHRSGI